MSQLMLEREERDKQIADLMESLRKIGYFESFQAANNTQFSRAFRTQKRLKGS